MKTYRVQFHRALNDVAVYRELDGIAAGCDGASFRAFGGDTCRGSITVEDRDTDWLKSVLEENKKVTSYSEEVA